MSDRHGSDRSFEARLESAFAESPALADADVFALRVHDALERNWLMRRLVIGALGFAGGLIGVAQLLRSGLVDHLGAVGGAWRLVNDDLTSLPVARVFSELFGAGPSTGAEVLWMSGAMAIIALGLFVTRAIREF
jgi:hypothetical protein